MPCKEQSMPKVVFRKLWIKTYFLLKFCFTLFWYAYGVVSLDPLGVSVETQRPLRGAKCIQLTTQQSSLEGYDGAMSGLCTGQIAAVMKLAVMKFASSPSWHQFMVESQINGLKSSASTDKSQSFTIVCTVLEKAWKSIPFRVVPKVWLSTLYLRSVRVNVEKGMSKAPKLPDA